MTWRNLVAVISPRILWLGLWLACVATPAELSAALTPETIYQKVLPSVMTLEVETQSGEKFVGSAVLVLADDTALTAWHVVADARSVWAVFADGERVKVTGCIDHASGRDLALLKLEKGRPHRRASLCRELQPVASRAYAVGAPRGFDFSITDGLISQVRTVNGLLQYQLSCPISPGNSGGPILNQRGEVIGIATWTKSDAQNVSFAVPVQEIVRLNVAQPPVNWEQLAAVNQVTAAGLRQLRPVTDKLVEEKSEAGIFAAFQKRLRESVGKSVTVVVQEEGRTNSFEFTVTSF